MSEVSAAPAAATSAPISAPVTTSTEGAAATTTNAPISVSDTGTQAPAAAEPVAVGNWTDKFSEDQKAYVTNKGFQDSAAVLDSYRNLEKLRGVPESNLLKMPETADAPEWKDVYAKLGKPDTPDGYGIQTPEGGDPAFSSWAKETFHGLNLSKDQAEGILAKFSDFQQGQKNDHADSYKSNVANEEVALKKDWGNAYHQNVAAAQRAAKEFGVPGEALEALEIAVGFDGVMKLMHSIGTKLGEPGYVSGNDSSGFGDNAVLTPQQARANLEMLKKDAGFTSKYLSGDSDAKAKMSRLHQMAYPAD